LSPRLQAAVDLIPPYSTENPVHIYDIGTDHGQIPLYLLQNGYKNITATDINTAPLETAKRFLAENGAEGVSFVLTNGLEGVEVAGPASVIIAGMGGETIAGIISGSAEKLHRANLILQPMTRHEHIRRSLYRNGFEIVKEVFVQPKFNLIQSCFTGQIKEITDYFSFTGKQTDKTYLIQQAKKLRKITIGNKNLTGVYRQLLLAIEQND
jgi:tRNA A22 N-methylase